MIVLFCADPLSPRRPDDAYSAEAAAATAAGLSVALVSYEALVDACDSTLAVRRVPAQPSPTPALYRGWMLRPERYHDLYHALLSRNVTLINDPSAYVHCHLLPESYPLISSLTFRTVWLPGPPPFDEAKIAQALLTFRSAPVVVKDYVKSRKHEWHEACFIPSAADLPSATRVVRRFLELQADDLVGGLVFRHFLQLESLGPHPKSQMPLTREYRTFWLDRRALLTTNYWECVDYQSPPPSPDTFAPTAETIRSRFFTMDVAKLANGDWVIVELGDGQVAGLPDDSLAAPFYQAIADALAR